MQLRNILFLALTATLPLMVFSCAAVDSYYLVGSRDQKRELKDLLTMLAKEPQVGENRFIIIQQIANIMYATGKTERLNLFLTTYVEKNPDDPFNAYYLLIVARNYKEAKATPFAIHYFERILKNHPDLLIMGKSVHLMCLRELIKLVDEPEHRVNYYKELISRFSDEIDPGSTNFFLARTYEELGEWEQAMQAYKKFLKYPETMVPGFSEAQRDVSSLVDFYNSSKSWAVEDLQTLIDQIETAIRTRNVNLLERYRAKVNFFAMSWEQEESDASAQVVFDLGTFLRTSQIGYSPELDKDSNAKEAYLKTWGWSYRIQTWYLYFRKIYFPADPEINGRWEWAGIYFGDKL